MPTIKQLCIYPVKSMRGISVQAAELTPRGLKYDRNWMAVEENGTFLTQRRIPLLATIQVSMVDDKLRLTGPSGDSILIPLKTSNLKEVKVNIWGDECRALDEGDEASEWLAAKLHQSNKKPIRLVRYHDSFRREVDHNYQKGENAHTAFADGFPFLVTSTASLEALNGQLAGSGSKPVEMNRFRPNIVLDGLPPFRENELNEFTASDNRYKLGIRKPCKRCKVTTVDQFSGEIEEPKEPLRTLTRMKTVPELNGAYFGQNSTLVLGEGEVIKVGDMVISE